MSTEWSFACSPRLAPDQSDPLPQRPAQTDFYAEMSAGARGRWRRTLVLGKARQIFAAKYVKVLPTEQELTREVERERRLIDARRVDTETI